MGRIDQDYATDSTVTGADKVIGTDAADGSTKNYTIDGIKGYMEGNLTGASDTYISLDGKTVTTANGLTTSIANATINTDGTVTSGDVLRGVDSADGTTKNYTVQSISDFTLGNIDVDNFVYTVYDNIVMDDTTDSTTTVLDYGVNVIRTSTVTDLACKLPQPVTGKKVTVVNKSSIAIKLFPSNVGGQINNYPIDTPAIVPNDGKSYDFVCTENPLPGEWTWNAPATGQYDSGDISVSITSATSNFAFDNPIVSAVDTNNIAVGVGPSIGFESYSWGADGKNKPLVYGTSFPLAFKPATKWNSVTRIKIYTNITGTSQVQLSNGSQTTYYANASTGNGYSAGDYVSNGDLFSGSTLDSNVQYGVITGTEINAGQYEQPNIGSPGTQYMIIDCLSTTPQIGDNDFGTISFPFSSPIPSGTSIDKYSSAYLSFQIKPLAYLNYGTINFKFRFILEYN